VSPWPRGAGRWLSGEAFAKRFLQLLETGPADGRRPGAAKKAQSELLRKRLRAENLYPLLWSRES
jgi:hypothetical protein